MRASKQWHTIPLSVYRLPERAFCPYTKENIHKIGKMIREVQLDGYLMVTVGILILNWKDTNYNSTIRHIRTAIIILQQAGTMVDIRWARQDTALWLETKRKTGWLTIMRKKPMNYLNETTITGYHNRREFDN